MHTVNYDHRGGRWCGPTVVAGVTGLSYSKVHALMRKDSGSRRIMGTSFGQLRKALQTAGYEMMEYRHYGRGKGPTLAAWCRKRTGEERAKTFIVNAGWHWVLVRSRYFLDSLSGGKPILLKDAPGRRKKVAAVYEVFRVKRVAHREIERILDGHKKAEAKKRSEDTIGNYERTRARKDRLACLKLLKSHGATRHKIVDEGCKYITVWLDHPVIKEFETLHYDWHETQRRFEATLERPKDYADEDKPGKYYYSE